jgi:hypothetical protein
MNRKKILKILAKYLPAFMLAPLFLTAPAVAAPTASPIAVFVNGMPLPGELAAYERDSEVYLPLRAVAETLGLNVGYDASARAAVITDDAAAAVITLALDDGLVTVNDVAFDQTAYDLVGSSLFVPSVFVSDYINRAAFFILAYDAPAAAQAVTSVSLFSVLPVDVGSGVSVSSLTYQYDEAVDDAGHVVTSLYTVPQFMGLTDKPAEASLNQIFSDRFYANQQDILSEYQSLTASATAEQPLPYEVKSDGAHPLAAYSYSSDLRYALQYDAGNRTLTVALKSYRYSGGAHGLEGLETYVLDLDTAKRLTLADLFIPGADYQAVLAAEMNKIRASGTEDWDIVREITPDDLAAEADNFFFQPGALVVYYQPYDVAPYARGLVEFVIPAEQLAAHLSARYAG